MGQLATSTRTREPGLGCCQTKHGTSTANDLSLLLCAAGQLLVASSCTVRAAFHLSVHMVLSLHGAETLLDGTTMTCTVENASTIQWAACAARTVNMHAQRPTKGATYAARTVNMHADTQ